MDMTFTCFVYLRLGVIWREGILHVVHKGELTLEEQAGQAYSDEHTKKSKLVLSDFGKGFSKSY